MDDEAGTADEVVFYTDIEVPGTQPFSGEMGKYGTADGIDSDGNLAIRTATDATLIASSEFPTGPGIRSRPGATAWSIEGREGAAGGSPTWSGQFHDVGQDQVPSVATGTFESVFGDIGRMSGAFGTTLQP